MSYLALIDASSQIILGGSDAVEAKWFTVEMTEEKSVKLHGNVTRVAESFTLTELQRVYEVILGQPLLMANFRRKVSPMVTLADEVKPEKSAGHRPSQLYRFNPNWKLDKLESEKAKN